MTPKIRLEVEICAHSRRAAQGPAGQIQDAIDDMLASYRSTTKVNNGDHTVSPRCRVLVVNAG